MISPKASFASPDKRRLPQEFSRDHPLTPEDFEMLVVAEKGA